MRKLCSKWLPRLLTVGQKQQRVDDSKCCLQLFQCNKKEFLCTYVTMDETWIHDFTPESNRQSDEWTAAGESRPKWPKMQTSAGNVLASIFWDAQGILFIDYLEKGRTINSEYYTALLVRQKEEIAKKRPHMKKKKVLFHQDNAPYHNGKTTWIEIWIASAPTLFSSSCLQRLLAVCRPQENSPGTIFGYNGEVISETEAYFEAKEKSFYIKGIKLLEKRWNMWSTLEGDYVDE